MAEGRATPFVNTRFRPVERLSTASLVARQLLEELGREAFSPGTRLPSERDLAQMLGVARSTLREAMAALELLGIVEVRPGSGSYLKADSSQLLSQALKWGLALGEPQVKDLVEVREHLEVLAARLAAERATAAGIKRLRGHLDRMHDAGEDVDAFVEADISFHLEIAMIAKNAVLQSVLESVRSLLTTWFDRTLRVEGTIAATLREHDAVLAAVEQRSPDDAEAAMRTLMTAADERIRRAK
jgi:DNA-binding FadR family transcriptional regulator